MPKPSDETEVESGSFVTRREFGSFRMEILGKIDDIPKALRTEFSSQVQQSKPQWGTIVTIMLTGLGTLTVVGIALVTALVVYVNMRFDIEKGSTAEFHRMQEAAWQQVWRQQNSSQERLENRVDDDTLDILKRWRDSLENSKETPRRTGNKTNGRLKPSPQPQTQKSPE